jgi:hypothetical protein
MGGRSRRTHGELTDFELAVHLFIPLTGPDQRNGYRYFTQIWHRCGDVLGIRHPINTLDLPAVVPATVDRLPVGNGALAASERPGDGVHQAFAYREHDMLCLSVMLAPGRSATGWAELESTWVRVVGEPDAALLGETRLLLARRRSRLRWPLVVGAAPATAGHLPGPAGTAAGGPGTGTGTGTGTGMDRWWADGVSTSGGLAVRELSAGPDDRRLRRVVVVSPPGGGDHLSSWAWSSGAPEPAPFARYLLHAAILRYELRVWLAGQHFRQLRQQADATLAELLPLLAEPADDTGPAAGLWDGYARRLDTLVADEAGLIGTTAELRAIRRTVQIAAANMVLAVRTEISDATLRAPGLFADDRNLAVWFEQQLDDDAEYLQAALYRASTIGALLDRSVQRREARRRERFTLVQTAVLGAVVMILTATETLQYKVPLPNGVQPAVIATLGAVTFYLPLVVVRLAIARRGGVTMSLEHLALATLAAAGAWTALAWLTHTVLAGPVDPWWTVASVAFVFAAAWLGVTLRSASSGRRRLPDGPGGADGTRDHQPGDGTGDGGRTRHSGRSSRRDLPPSPRATAKE